MFFPPLSRFIVFIVAIATWVAPQAALACIWDTDTIVDELQMHASDLHLITGQFPHHGPAYYQARVRESQQALAKDPLDLVSRNDLAVALLKLGQYDEAEEEFRRIEEQEPGRYQTLSNLGVLFKKRGEYTRAAKYTKQALEINPEGHLGLGDYYLFMLEWRAAHQAGGVPTANFLGDSYESGTYLNKEDAERIRALIRSDRGFADAFVVFGDHLQREFHLNLAFWAYVRAKTLGHPAPDVIDQRIAEIFDHWEEASSRLSGEVVDDPDEVVAKIESLLESAATWEEEFKTAEAELIAKQGHTGPGAEFVDVEAELLRRGIQRNTPPELGMVHSYWRVMKELWWWLAIAAMLILFAVSKRRGASAKERHHKE